MSAARPTGRTSKRTTKDARREQSMKTAERTYHPSRVAEMAAYVANKLRYGQAVEVYRSGTHVVVQAVSTRDAR